METRFGYEQHAEMYIVCFFFEIVSCILVERIGGGCMERDVCGVAWEGVEAGSEGGEGGSAPKR